MSATGIFLKLVKKCAMILDELSVRGFTQWMDVKRKGSEKIEPHEGTYTWPELNNAHLTMIENKKVESLLSRIKKLDEKV